MSFIKCSFFYHSVMIIQQKQFLRRFQIFCISFVLDFRWPNSAHRWSSTIYDSITIITPNFRCKSIIDKRSSAAIANRCAFTFKLFHRWNLQFYVNKVQRKKMESLFSYLWQLKQSWWRLVWWLILNMINGSMSNSSFLLIAYIQANKYKLYDYFCSGTI